MTQMIEIQMLSRDSSTHIKKMVHIKNLVNRVYKIAEKGLYAPGTDRTSVEETKEFTRNGEIAVARLNRKIVGCIRIRRLDETIGEFGMLAVDSPYQKNGIGRELIRFAEQHFQKDRFHKIQLELLVPVTCTHPDKVFVKNWYTRIGYTPVNRVSVKDLYPKFSDALVKPCEFIVFQKSLKL